MATYGGGRVLGDISSNIQPDNANHNIFSPRNVYNNKFYLNKRQKATTKKSETG